MGLAILVWIILSVIVASIGTDRKIGSTMAFFISIILSPVIGIIAVLASEKISDIEIKDKIIETVDKQQQRLEDIKTGHSSSSLADEINKLKALLDDGTISQEEFNQAKKKLLS